MAKHKKTQQHIRAIIQEALRHLMTVSGSIKITDQHYLDAIAERAGIRTITNTDYHMSARRTRIMDTLCASPLFTVTKEEISKAHKGQKFRVVRLADHVEVIFAHKSDYVRNKGYTTYDLLMQDIEEFWAGDPPVFTKGKHTYRDALDLEVAYISRPPKAGAIATDERTEGASK